MGSLIGNANLIKKVYFPREVFVVSAIGSLLVSFLIELGVLAAILLLLGNKVLPWIPVVLVLVVIQAFFVLGIGVAAEVLNVYFRDVQHLVGDRAAWRSSTRRRSCTRSGTSRCTAHRLGARRSRSVRIYRLNPLVRFVGSPTATCCTTCGSRRALGSRTSIGWAVGAHGRRAAGSSSKLDRRLAEEV